MEAILLNAMHAVQDKEGYLSQEALASLAQEFGVTKATIYDTASFYSMLRFSPQAKVNISICRGAPCHVAGADAVIEALEATLDIKVGGSTPDGKYSLRYTECLGQCQSSPTLLVNGELHTDMTPEKVKAMLTKGGAI